MDEVVEEVRLHLLSDYLLFTKTFFELRTGKEFVVPKPVGRQSHVTIIAKALEKVFDGEIDKLIINIPPRYFKTTLLTYFMAWAYANYGDCNFIYTSYAKSLAKIQTQTVRDIISMPYFYKLFGTKVSEDTSAKDDFLTTKGGAVFAAGAMGAITGRGAGIKNIDRFGGAIIMDDMHKPAEVSSDTMRQSILEWYDNTLASRVNDKKTPIIFICQRLHEDDLAANLAANGGWHTIALEALDGANNALYPEMHTTEKLIEMKQKNPYVFASQYQQNPLPAGGGIFQKDWFLTLPEEPFLLSTFITADTAETDKTYNDATAFCFWGLYKIKNYGSSDPDVYGLHWLDAVELHIEPKDLQNEFLEFYAKCMRHKLKPKFAAIERKSTGTTLLSTLKNIQGIRTIEIVRTKASGSKTTRFLEAQEYVASKRITFTDGAAHLEKCVEHCSKITANDTHKRDDLADCLYDAIKLALIDQTLIPKPNDSNNIVKEMANSFRAIQHARMGRGW